MAGTSVVSWLRQLSDGGETPERLWVGPLLMVGGGITAVWAWRKVRKARHQQRLLTAGNWRQGLFVTPDALLMHIGGRCNLIPRDTITAFESRQVGSKEERRRESWLIARDKDANLVTIDLPAEVGWGSRDAYWQLQQWLKTGQFASPVLG